MLYVAAAAYIFNHESRFFYKHSNLSKDFNYEFGLDFQELFIPITNDINLHGLWFKHDQKKGIVLLFPASDYVSHKIDSSHLFYYNLGYDLIIPGYRGVAKSTGSYSNEEAMYEDAIQWSKLSKSLADSLPIIVVGQEFGSGLAAKAYSSSFADLLILEKPYYEWNLIAMRRYFWWLPHSYFTKFKIPTWEYIRASTKPIILIHPFNSKKIGYKNSELLLSYFKPGDQLISLEGEEINHYDKKFLDKFEQINLP
jgi:hypothetical protein